MVEKIADLNLPNSVVARLVKDALPEGISIGKEARLAIAKAASIFIIYLTSSTASAARKQKHKSLSSDNVFSALEEIEFENFIEPLRTALETFRKNTADKKGSKTNDASEMNGSKIDADDSIREESAVMEIED